MGGRQGHRHEIAKTVCCRFTIAVPYKPKWPLANRKSATLAY